jgi:hypothetical protein
LEASASFTNVPFIAHKHFSIPCSDGERTFDAAVLDRQVRLEVLVTGFHVHEVLVEDAEAAAVPSGTVPIENVQNVIRAANIAEVLLDTPAQVHSTVTGTANDDHFISSRTSSPEVFGLADDLIGNVCNIANGKR